MDSKLLIHLVTIFLFCRVAITGVHASCLTDPPTNVAITETDPPGHVIFSQNGSLSTKWKFIIDIPPAIKDHLGAYFSMENNETTVTFSIKKTVDLEAIHEKWNVELTVVGMILDCSENGSPVGGRRQMFVTVAPVNEFDPEFINTPLIRNVPEDAPISSSVITLRDHARDRDINTGQNEITKFHILKYYNPELDGSSHFGMPNSQEGLVDVGQTLDYESMPENIKYYNLNVSVEDYGGRMALTTVRINILDADDQDPEFFIPGCGRDCYISYTAYISNLFMGLIEKVQPSQIRARDRDKTINNSIAYSIKGSNPAGYESHFYQDDTTGEVNVTKLFNETEKSLTEITLFLQAKEISVQGRVESTTFLIHIEDARAACEIDPPSNVPILETDPPGHVLFSQAGSASTQWTFNIDLPSTIKNQLKDYFSLETNATTTTFSLKKTVDLEDIHDKWGVTLVAIGFSLDCRENGQLQGSRRQLFVTVAPVDEFYPVFMDPPIVRNLSEGTPVGATVIRLTDHVQDRDINAGQSEITMFGILKYRTPELDGSSHFNMPNIQQGVVAVGQPLDYEAMPNNAKYYYLQVSVEDYGGKVAVTTMKINILDVDDEDPEFFNSQCRRDCYTYYKADVNQNFTGLIKTIIPGQIQARDRDTAINNAIAYSTDWATPSGYETYFRQDSKTGEVYVIKPLGDTPRSVTHIILFLEAKEISPLGRATVTTFRINIEGRTSQLLIG